MRNIIAIGMLLVLVLVFLSGCATPAPVIPKWPSVPAELLVSCPDLKTVDTANDKLSALIDTVTDNYKEYYDCKDKVNDWTTWYTEQEKLWKTLK